MTMQSVTLPCDPGAWSLEVLLIESDREAADTLTELLGGVGHTVRAVAHPGDAIAMAQRQSFDVVVTAASIDDSLLSRLRSARPEIHVVLLADPPRADEALAATRAGADYLPRSAEYRNLLAPIAAVARRRELKVQTRQAIADGEPALLGGSPLIKAVRRAIQQAALESRAVLVTGERGTGKKLAGRVLSAAGPAGQSLAVVDATTIGELDETLDEIAGGTLLISSIDRLDAGALRDLVAALSSRSRFRLIATSSNEAAIDPSLESIFDTRIEMPALRRRRVAIPLLVNHFIDRRWRSNTPPPRLTAEAWTVLVGRELLGNVAELEQTIAHALIRCEGSGIQPEHLSGELLDPGEIDRIVPLGRAALTRPRRSPRRRWGKTLPSLVIGWGR